MPAVIDRGRLVLAAMQASIVMWSGCGPPPPPPGPAQTDRQPEVLGIDQIVRVLDTSTSVATIAIDTSGDALVALADKDPDGIPTFLTGAAYVDASGRAAVVRIGSDGLPSTIVTDDAVVLLSDYIGDSVTVQVNVDGQSWTQTVDTSDVRPSIDALRDLAGKQIAGVSAAARKSGTSHREEEGLEDVTLWLAGHIFGIAGCVSAVATPNLVSALACGAYLVSTFSKPKSPTELGGDLIGTGIDVARCVRVPSPSDCGSAAVGVIGLVNRLTEEEPPEEPECPAGFSIGYDGQCRNRDGCLEGEVWLGLAICCPAARPYLVSGEIVCTDDPNGCRVGESRAINDSSRCCPDASPYVDASGACGQCPSGFQRQASGDCRNADGCPPDLPFAVNGFCFASPDPCGPGSAVGNDGECLPGCPPNSTQNTSGTCVCDPGFSSCGTACVPFRNCPENASPACDGDGCVCDNGYVSDGSECWPEVNCGSGALPTAPNECTCGSGFTPVGTTCITENRSCDGCQPGSCQPLNSPPGICCSLDVPYLWGDDRCHTEPPSTTCSDPGGVRCTCPGTHYCIGNWCNGVLWHAEGITCGDFDCND